MCESLHTRTCMPDPWTLCSCSWMCLSSSCCRWMLAWIILVLCSSWSFRCCMAFTCAVNSITGCGWKEKKNRLLQQNWLCLHAARSTWCSDVNYETLANEHHKLHSRAAVNDCFLLLISLTVYFILSFNWFIIWSINSQKIVKNANNFPRAQCDVNLSFLSD